MSVSRHIFFERQHWKRGGRESILAMKNQEVVIYVEENNDPHRFVKIALVEAI